MFSRCTHLDSKRRGWWGGGGDTVGRTQVAALTIEPLRLAVEHPAILSRVPDSKSEMRNPGLWEIS